MDFFAVIDRYFFFKPTNKVSVKLVKLHLAAGGQANCISQASMFFYSARRLWGLHLYRRFY